MNSGITQLLHRGRVVHIDYFTSHDTALPDHTRLLLRTKDASIFRTLYETQQVKLKKLIFIYQTYEVIYDTFQKTAHFYKEDVKVLSLKITSHTVLLSEPIDAQDELIDELIGAINQSINEHQKYVQEIAVDGEVVTISNSTPMTQFLSDESILECDKRTASDSITSEVTNWEIFNTLYEFIMRVENMFTIQFTFTYIDYKFGVAMFKTEDSGHVHICFFDWRLTNKKELTELDTCVELEIYEHNGSRIMYLESLLFQTVHVECCPGKKEEPNYGNFLMNMIHELNQIMEIDLYYLHDASVATEYGVKFNLDGKLWGLRGYSFYEKHGLMPTKDWIVDVIEFLYTDGKMSDVKLQSCVATSNEILNMRKKYLDTTLEQWAQKVPRNHRSKCLQSLKNYLPHIQSTETLTDLFNKLEQILIIKRNQSPQIPLTSEEYTFLKSYSLLCDHVAKDLRLSALYYKVYKPGQTILDKNDIIFTTTLIQRKRRKLA